MESELRNDFEMSGDGESEPGQYEGSGPGACRSAVTDAGSETLADLNDDDSEESEVG